MTSDKETNHKLDNELIKKVMKKGREVDKEPLYRNFLTSVRQFSMGNILSSCGIMPDSDISAKKGLSSIQVAKLYVLLNKRDEHMDDLDEQLKKIHLLHVMCFYAKVARKNAAIKFFCLITSFIFFAGLLVYIVTFEPDMTYNHWFIQWMNIFTAVAAAVIFVVCIERFYRALNEDVFIVTAFLLLIQNTPAEIRDRALRTDVSVVIND